jgi:hypothetical protein
MVAKQYQLQIKLIYYFMFTQQGCHISNSLDQVEFEIWAGELVVNSMYNIAAVESNVNTNTT